jgi:hypothetical protein
LYGLEIGASESFYHVQVFGVTVTLQLGLVIETDRIDD